MKYLELGSQIDLYGWKISSSSSWLAELWNRGNEGYKMDSVQKILSNMKRLEKLNPSIVEAIEEGCVVAAYDIKTRMVITKRVIEGTLQIEIIKDGYLLPDDNRNFDL